MAWDLSRIETLPFPPPHQNQDRTATSIDEDQVTFGQAGPLDGIGRNLAITGLGS
jgi:error-prone DNA polymerase